MPRYKNIQGEKYGRLTAVRYLRTDSKGQALWICHCDCGKEIQARTKDLRYGNTKSCGCLVTDTSTEIGRRRALSWDPIYFVVEGAQCCVVPLGKTEITAIIDIRDLDLIRPYRWVLSGNGYAHAHNRGATGKILMHRLILGLAPEDEYETDHINHNRIDNRRCNLRLCSRVQNCWNQVHRKDNTSGHPRVYLHKRTNRWIAQIVVNGIHRHLGYYDRYEDALEIRRRAQEDSFGEFSNG